MLNLVVVVVVVVYLMSYILKIITPASRGDILRRYSVVYSTNETTKMLMVG